MSTSEETITTIPVTACFFYNVTSTTCNGAITKGELCYTLRIENRNLGRRRRSIAKKHNSNPDFGGVLQQILKGQTEESS